MTAATRRILRDGALGLLTWAVVFLLGFGYGGHRATAKWSGLLDEHIAAEEMLQIELASVLGEQARLITIGEWTSVTDSSAIGFTNFGRWSQQERPLYLVGPKGAEAVEVDR